MVARNRIDGQDAFVLHTQPFRETSLLLEVFTRDWGRVALVARGARRPRSMLRGVLLEFQPLEIGWFGQGELRTLAKAEWQGGQPLLAGRSLLVGYYLNELLLRLLAREDPHAGLFATYRETLRGLTGDVPAEVLLRRFELALVRELGYALTLEREAESGRPVLAERMYAWLPERGLVAGEQARNVPCYSGRSLLALAREDFGDAQTLQHGKALMRQVINHYLGGQPLNSRRVFMELNEL